MGSAIRTAGLLVVVLLTAAACTKGKESHRIPPVMTKDKEMSCEEIQLEMNDAFFTAEMAKRNKGMRAGNVLWPFGYPATYLSANEAIAAANDRIGYLQQIYRIKACNRALYEKL